MSQPWPGAVTGWWRYKRNENPADAGFWNQGDYNDASTQAQTITGTLTASVTVVPTDPVPTDPVTGGDVILDNNTANLEHFSTYVLANVVVDEDGKVPSTGDASQLMLTVGMLLASAAALGGLAVVSRKRRG